MVQELVHFAGSIFSCSMMVLFKNWAHFFGSHLSSALHGFLKVFAPHVSFCGRWPWSRVVSFFSEDAVSGMYQTTCKYQAGIQKTPRPTCVEFLCRGKCTLSTPPTKLSPACQWQLMGQKFRFGMSFVFWEGCVCVCVCVCVCLCVCVYEIDVFFKITGV